MDTESLVRPSPSFLGLPLDIRNKIYRILLINPRPIGYPSGRRRGDDDFGWDIPRKAWLKKDKVLPLANALTVLVVCRQVHTEASAILYCENTFAFKIYARGDEERAPFLYPKLGPSADLVESQENSVPIEKMERFIIKVELQQDCSFFVTRSCVRPTVRILSKSPKPRHLEILLEDDHDNLTRKVTRVLEPFTLMRNVESVKFMGVPPVYAEYLNLMMTRGPRALAGLMKRYYYLQHFLKPRRYAEEQVQHVCEAMERGHSSRFEMLARGVSRIVERKEVDGHQRIKKWCEFITRQKRLERESTSGDDEELKQVKSKTKDDSESDREVEQVESEEEDECEIDATERTKKWVEGLAAVEE